MLRTVCKSKLHGATVTEANVQYTGSLTLDAHLMQAADLVPYEQVHVVDVDNGARVVTYCIEGVPGSGTVCVNGAAARLISAGDKVIVISYVQVTPAELVGFAPNVIVLDQRNRIREVVTEARRFSEEGSPRSMSSNEASVERPAHRPGQMESGTSHRLPDIERGKVGIPLGSPASS